QHIVGHRYFLSLEQHRDVPLQEAAASWYDHVYHPIAEAIRKHKVVEQLHGWTEADLYVEITRRWLELSKEGEPSGPDPAVDALLVDIVRGRVPEAEAGEGVLLDGFPRTVGQAQALDNMLSDEGHKVDFVVALGVPEAELVDRLLHRAEVEGREDDTRQAIEE